MGVLRLGCVILLLLSIRFDPFNVIEGDKGGRAQKGLCILGISIDLYFKFI